MNKSLNDDFEDFKNDTGLSTPGNGVKSLLFSKVKADLEPDTKTIYLKLISIQAFVGFLSLAFCPQFNFSLTNNHAVFHFFHRNFGEYVCYSICGAIFWGTGAIFASNILRLSEIHAIKKSLPLCYFALSGAGLLTFFMIGAEIYAISAILWALGGITAGYGLMILNQMLRIKLYQN